MQKEVAELLKGKILVGHALRNDLRVNCKNQKHTKTIYKGFLQFILVIKRFLIILQALLLSHPKTDIRDTAEYQPFLKYCFYTLFQSLLYFLDIIANVEN